MTKWKWSRSVVSDSLRPHWHQASPSMGFSRQQYWGGLPFPCLGNLPDSGLRDWTQFSLTVDRRFTVWVARDKEAHKKGSVVLVIKQTQIKTTMRCGSTPTWIGAVEKIDYNNCWRVETQTLMLSMWNIIILNDGIQYRMDAWFYLYKLLGNSNCDTVIGRSMVSWGCIRRNRDIMEEMIT